MLVISVSIATCFVGGHRSTSSKEPNVVEISGHVYSCMQLPST
jgi:hypothetical protein